MLALHKGISHRFITIDAGSAGLLFGQQQRCHRALRDFGKQHGTRLESRVPGRREPAGQQLSAHNELSSREQISHCYLVSLMHSTLFLIVSSNAFSMATQTRVLHLLVAVFRSTSSCSTEYRSRIERFAWGFRGSD